ncbi:MAG TPA: oxidoreductase [Deltaproteobacteria bacterium]|nr:oxidoreductase [Deltaproteobacteria bacterium]
MGRKRIEAKETERNFVLIGAAGYVAPRHMKAIKDTGNRLIAALDKHDAVGVIDNYFPDADFFVEFERLDRHVEKLRRLGHERKVDYVSIASPNYLHDAHIRFALRVGAHAICEKPLVLNPWNVDALADIERESGRKVNAVLQLRHHPAIVALKQRVNKTTSVSKADVDLTYVTSRGKWYMVSWKGDVPKSGGIATNIGIHFFDMLQWVFGPVQSNRVHLLEPKKASGFLELRDARVRWFLSLDREDLPEPVRTAAGNTYRSVSVNGEEIEFSDGFGDLHTVSYREILRGNGFGLSDVKPAIEIVYDIRNATNVVLKGDYHPLLKSVTRE